MLDGYSAVLVLRRVAELYNTLLADDGGGRGHRGRVRRLSRGSTDLLAAEAGMRGPTAPRQTVPSGMPSLPRRRLPPALPAGRTAAAGSLVRPSVALPGRPRPWPWSRRAGSAPALVLTAASLYLHRITGERDVSVALPVTARRGKLAKSTPSMLSNIVPVRLAVDPGATVRETVAAVGAACAAPWSTSASATRTSPPRAVTWARPSTSCPSWTTSPSARPGAP